MGGTTAAEVSRDLRLSPAHPCPPPTQGLVYPLDTIRTRLAVCHSSEYGGIWQTAVRLARTEGYSAFYRGLVPSMVGAAAAQRRTAQRAPWLPHAAAARARGPVASRSSPGRGPRSLRPHPCPLARLPFAPPRAQCGILPYAGCDIALFEILNEHLHDSYAGRPPHLAIIAAGMASSVVAQFVSYPLALVRTRLQAQGVGGNPIKYSGMVDVFAQTLQNEGVMGLYKVRRGPQHLRAPIPGPFFGGSSAHPSISQGRNAGLGRATPGRGWEAAPAAGPSVPLWRGARRAPR
jgi:hypothetical protein